MARDAIDSIRKEDTERLSALLSQPGSAERTVSSLAPKLGHGPIKYRGDSYLFPLPTYDRFYEVMSDPAVDGNEWPPVRLCVEFVNAPLRIDGIFTIGTPPQ